MIKLNKKGLAVSVIIVIIIVVIGFAILLFFYSQIAWTGNIDRTVCHQSVIYRATLPEFANAKELVPLKCRTEKICLSSSSFGKCKEFEGAKGITTIKISDVEDIEKVLAQEILSCWETMGEGKLSLFSGGVLLDNYGIGDIQSSCVICSRISFDDESLRKSKIDKDKINVFNYMSTHKVPNKDISYYNKILGNSGSLSINENERIKNIDSVLNEPVLDGENVFIPSDSNSNDLTVLFMQATSPKWQDIIAGDLALLGIGAVGSKTTGSFIPKTISGNKLVGKATGFAARFAFVAAIMGIAYQVNNYWENKGITASYCGDVKVGDDAQQGCSVVRTMNYNANDIVQFCGKIESIS